MSDEDRPGLTRVTTADEHAYFTINKPPSSLSNHVEAARDFIERHASSSRRVALVTSGGTTVPLENQTVRFIDNFSAGTRGATSAEYLLDAGYGVIFLHRQHSLLPFSRHFSHSTNCFLDFMDFACSTDGVSASDNSVVIRDEYQSQMREVLQRYKSAQNAGLLLTLPFVTINEYLWSLREIARLMKPLGSGALFYLAAAVSDFFVPADRMVEHKIQSGVEFHGANATDRPAAAHMQGQSLVIDLDPVPKFLKRVVDAWAPNAMIVSFKLETDPAILTEKARHALKKYAHHLVIGNLLTTRKWEVVFVSNVTESHADCQIKEQWVRVPRAKRQASVSGVQELVGRAQNTPNETDRIDMANTEPPIEIESLIIPEVSKLHETFMDSRA
ncbi:MAG: hypothetical protein Q9162_003307 [Coniocarpon cinnabarinum]